MLTGNKSGAPLLTTFVLTAGATSENHRSSGRRDKEHALVHRFD
jgi:hypothetical protein